MPKRHKQTKDDKVLDCERPPPALTLGNFLDAQLASKQLVDEYAAAEDTGEAEAAAAAPIDSKPNGLPYSIRRNKKGNLTVAYENRSKGKKVTVIGNVTGDASSLVSELKRLTGSGGVQKGECIELQGDRRDFLAKFLKGHPSLVNYR